MKREPQSLRVHLRHAAHRIHRVTWMIDTDANCSHSAPEGRIPDIVQKSCSRPCVRCQTPCKARPSARQLATNCSLSSITEHCFQGIPSSPYRRKVLPMCPVQCVTYVSGCSSEPHVEEISTLCIDLSSAC